MNNYNPYDNNGVQALDNRVSAIMRRVYIKMFLGMLEIGRASCRERV